MDAVGAGVIVVDVGCADHSAKSVEYLIGRFHPDEFVGFDPYPGIKPADYWEGTTHVRISNEAAWTHDGEIDYTVDGDCSHVGEGPLTVPCFDLAALLATYEAGTILKIDAEGAEYELLPHLIATGEDKRLGLLLIEWHFDDHGLTEQLSCPIEMWEF